MRPIFDLGPRYAEGACAEWVATEVFARLNLGHERARAARARAYYFFILFFIININNYYNY
jgi:hypothetical protein